MEKKLAIWYISILVLITLPQRLHLLLLFPIIIHRENIEKWVNRCVSWGNNLLVELSKVFCVFCCAPMPALYSLLWKWVAHFADWANDLRCCSIKIEQHVVKR